MEVGFLENRYIEIDKPHKVQTKQKTSKEIIMNNKIKFYRYQTINLHA